MTTLPIAPGARAVTFRSYLGDAAEVGHLLALPGALREGHFRLLSGLHTDCFLAFSVLADEQHNLDRIGDWLGPTVDAWRADAVVAPSTAGVGLAATLARRISAPLHLASVGGDGRPEDLIGSALTHNAQVLIVNDVTTTGTAIRTLAEIVTSNGGTVAGATWFASRGLQRIEGNFDFPMAHVVDVELGASEAGSCTQCQAGGNGPLDAFDLN